MTFLRRLLTALLSLFTRSVPAQVTVKKGLLTDCTVDSHATTITPKWRT